MQKNYYKPFYKKKLRLRENILEKKSPFSFKKKKWKLLLILLKKKTNKKFFDSTIYFKPKFGSFFQKNFKQNLLLKQKISLHYGVLLLKKLKNIYNLGFKLFKTQLKKNLNLKLEFFFFKFLEARVDIVLYRSHFAKSIRESKVFIQSGHVYLNGNQILSNSVILKKGDLLTFNPKLTTTILQNLKDSTIFNYLPKNLLINFYTLQIYIILDVERIKLYDIHPFRINFHPLIKKLTL